MATPSQVITQEWKGFDANRRKELLAKMTPEQKKNLRTSLESPAPVQTPKPVAAFLPAPPRTTEGWFGDAEKDLREGGQRTGVGKALGYMQGRGNKGYSGLGEDGVGDFMGSPELGMLQVGKGISEIPSHPVKAAGNVIGGILKAATIPSMVMAGPEIKAVGELLPSTEKAAQIFKDVAESANNVPVRMKNTWPALDEFMKYAESGGTKPKVITDMMTRLDDFQKGPMTYEDARRFYTNISRLSDQELSTLNPNMRRLMGGVKEAFKKDIGDAAAEVNQAANYYKGLKEYARGAKLEKAASEMWKWALRLGGTAALGAAGYEGVKMAGGVGRSLVPQ
ncbi:MAG: hypothetical protein ABSC05_02730 [Candidatus Solibacter sp.]|jgi:hypothetical protein